MFRISHWIFLVALAVAAVGCKPPAQPMPTVGSVAPAIVSSGPPITDDEAAKYGEEVAKAFNEKKIDDLARLIPLDDLMIRSVSDLGLDQKELRGFRDGFTAKGGERAVLTQWSDKFSKCKFLRVRTQDQQKRVMIRVRPEEVGVNYLEFYLARNAAGKPIAEDIYMMMAGDTFSQILRRLIIPAFAAIAKGARTDTAKLEKEKMDRFAELGRAVRAGDNAEAVRLFRKMPADQREQKYVLLIAIQSFSATNEVEYAREVERYRQLYPSDPSVDLVSSDYFFLKKDFAEMRNCLRRVDKAIGGDPLLLALEANSFLEEGKVKEAREAAEKVVLKAPDLEEGRNVLLLLALKAKDFVEADRHFRKLVEDCRLEFDVDAFDKFPEYAEFSKSPQYEGFKKWYKNRGDNK